MKRALTAAGVQAVEAEAARRGRSMSALMESAGMALADRCLRLAGPRGCFFVLCGVGNNGGDGWVAARKLKEAGRVVYVEEVGDRTKRSALAGQNLASLIALEVSPMPLPRDTDAVAGDVVVDALFGTGLRRAPSGAAAEAIERMHRWRAAGARVVAADLPSGLPSDGGAPFTPCVAADLTVTFGVLKVGQLSAAGAGQCGSVEVVDIGLPEETEWPLESPAVFLLETDDAIEAIPARTPDTNKGSYGHALVVAGGPGKSGAAALCARAVLRSGAGLCTVAARPQSLEGVVAASPELMSLQLGGDGPLGLGDVETLRAGLTRKHAWVIGPGIPRGAHTRALLAQLLREVEIPVVIDADALNALGTNVEVLRESAGPVVLTPHPGEMARLMGADIAKVQSDRLGAARGLARRTRAVVVLKGARTVIAAPDGRCFVNPTGNAGMATGGTGDVLAGICGGLLAQGIAPIEAACTAVFAHGLAGDLAAERFGQLGLIASDVLEALGAVWSRWKR